MEQPPSRASDQPGAVPWHRRPAVLAVGTALLAALCYLNTLGGEFVYDDARAIVGNPVVTGPLSPALAFSSDFWGGHGATAVTGSSFRPITSLLYAVLWHLGGGRPWLFHATSLTLHALVTAAFFRVLAWELGSPLAALAATALFATHALHTEAVASLVSMADLLALLVALTLVALHRSKAPRAIALAPAVLLTGLLCKESIVGFLPVLLLADLLRKDLSVRTLIPRWLGHAGALGVAVALRAHALPQLISVRPDPLGNTLAHAALAPRIVTAARLFGHGLELLLAPFILLPDYGANVFPASTHLDGLVALGAAGAAGLGWLVLRWRRERPEVALAAAWLLVPGFLAVNSLILLPVTFAERWWYLPSAGACVLFGASAEWLSRRTNARAVWAAALCVALLHVPLTVIRNRAWASYHDLWAAAVVDEPMSANAQYSYAIALVERRRIPEALAHCEAAARLVPAWTEPPGCMGRLLDRLGRPDEAGRAFRRMRANGRASTPMWLAYAQHLGRQGARDAALAELDAMRQAGRWDAATQRYHDRLMR